jgi:hypothetical protein
MEAQSEWARAVQPFDAPDENYLSLNPGDVIHVLDKDPNSDYYLGECDGTTHTHTHTHTATQRHSDTDALAVDVVDD